MEEQIQRLQELVQQQDSPEAFHEAVSVAIGLLGGFLQDIHTLAMAQHRLASGASMTSAEALEEYHNG